MPDKTKAEWLREFADAMEADPVGWWLGFDYLSRHQWTRAQGEHALVMKWLFHSEEIRRRPRTVTRFDRYGNEVELPVPLQEKPAPGATYWIAVPDNRVASFIWYGIASDMRLFDLGVCFATREDAQAWTDYFKSLLEANDE